MCSRGLYSLKSWVLYPKSLTWLCEHFDRLLRKMPTSMGPSLLYSFLEGRKRLGSLSLELSVCEICVKLLILVVWSWVNLLERCYLIIAEFFLHPSFFKKSLFLLSAACWGLEQQFSEVWGGTFVMLGSWWGSMFLKAAFSKNLFFLLVIMPLYSFIFFLNKSRFYLNVKNFFGTTRLLGLPFGPFGVSKIHVFPRQRKMILIYLLIFICLDDYDLL